MIDETELALAEAAAIAELDRCFDQRIRTSDTQERGECRRRADDAIVRLLMQLDMEEVAVAFLKTKGRGPTRWTT